MGVEKYDVIIIGAGPAGLTAALYGARAGLSVVVIEKVLPGGYMAVTDLIENYPGFPDGIKGPELSERMKQHAQRFGALIVGSEVKSLKKKGSIVVVETASTVYESRTAIIATGTVPKQLGVPGEKELRGRGVSYCATCDGPLFRGQDIAVIGCGNSGLQEGHFLLNFAARITFVEFLPRITADQVLQAKFKDKPAAQFLLGQEVVSINGVDRTESITVRDRKTGSTKDISVSGVFIYIGTIPSSHFLQGAIQLDSDGFIITSERLETSLEGVYAAGDVRSKNIRQVITACGEGAVAALHAYHYVESLKM